MNKKKLLGGLFGLSMVTLVAFVSLPNRIQITRSINTFAEILRTLDRDYVDSLDLRSLSRSAINAMLKEIDPYTEYYSEEDVQRANMITKAEYAGIGVLMQEIRGDIVIRSLYDGSPSKEAGLKVADRLTALDGKPVKGWGITKVTDYLKGKPGEKVTLTVMRPGTKEPKTFELERRIIKMPVIPYYGIVKGDIGYLNLSTFSSEVTANEVKAALEDLMEKGAKSLLIDLRNNGGGRMDHAIRICSYFLPKGSHVLTMRGRHAEQEKSFSTMEDPIVPGDMPLVILVNGNTASASEILSGTMQDYDRAVIVGDKTFGKGLVQTVVNMPYRAQMKYTQAKYYIPSGRCVQAITYDHSKSSLAKSVRPDSLLKPFKTKGGRTVYEGSGIMPDKKVPFVVPVPESFTEMDRQNMFFDYGTEYVLAHPTLAPIEKFEVTDKMVADFEAFLKRKKFTFTNSTQLLLDSLVKKSKADGYYKANQKSFDALSKGLKTDVKADFKKYPAPIRQRLAYELLSRYYGQAEIIRYQLRDDKQYDSALALLADPKEYSKILNSK